MPSFNKFYKALAAVGINWATDDIKVALLTNSWTPSRALDFYSELDNELANGDGYATEGYALLSKAVNTASNIIYLFAADPTWTFTATKAFRYAVFYKDSGVPGTSPLIWYVDLGDVSVSGVYTLDLNALGLISLGDA